MTAVRVRRGARARRDGRRGEIVGALWLMAKGYRILGLRLKTPLAEIDLLVRRGKVVSVVEVKRRVDLATALEAVGPRQRDRLIRAARWIAAARPELAGASVRLDLIALAPGRWPRHIRDAWRES